MNYRKFTAILVLALTVFSCTISSDVDDPQTDLENVNFKVYTYNNERPIYDTLLLRGSFSENLPEVKIELVGNDTYEIEFIESTTSEVYAFIPKNVAPGDYLINFIVDGESLSNDSSGDPLDLKVLNRPLINTISKTTVSPNDEVSVTGGPFFTFINEVKQEGTVWIMGLNYTNTVSEITINEAGDAATVIIDDAVPPGEYKFHILVDSSEEYYTQWSNEIRITVQ